nr:MAG TPA: hypothetical protein [Caudoviricetes sp.]
MPPWLPFSPRQILPPPTTTATSIPVSHASLISPAKR